MNRSTAGILLVLFGVFGFSAAGRCADESAGRLAAHRAIVGWDDSVICCGPGTVAGMDSPEAVRQMVRRWKARGFGGIYWRVDEFMLPDQFVVRHSAKRAPATNYLLARMENVLREFPVLKTLQAACDRERIELWAWYPTIYSSGAPPTGPGFTAEWLYENRFGHDHPEVLTVDCAGNKQYMIWEYAYPQARATKVAEFVEFARTYGFKRFVACLRTEAAQMQPAPKHADQFGFNTPIVAEMKGRFGVDILSDPRFDFSHPKFNVRDPMVENWRRLRGEHLTQFYRELRAGLSAVDPRIQIAVQIPGERAFTCLGNWPLEWRTWIDEGLVNELVVPVVLDGYEGYGPRADLKALGYLDGSLPIEAYREFIRKSRQPTARVIQAGGPGSSFDPPPLHADGWRLDTWFDLWCFNQAERWEQWRRDFAEFGHIKFIEQDFDDFPAGSDGYGGGWGDFAHRPDLRSGPGYWITLGDGRDQKPFAQSRIAHTRPGPAKKTSRAIQLTRDAAGAASLQGRHHGGRNRGFYPFPGDTSISNGAATLELWLHRPDEKSAFVAYLQHDADPKNRYEVGVYVTPGAAGPVFFRQDGKYVASSATMAIGAWHRLTLDVDLENRTYSAVIAADGRSSQDVCRNVKYATSENAFNMIEVAPQGETGSVFFLDDVSLRWRPRWHATAPGPRVVLREGFELAPPAATVGYPASDKSANAAAGRPIPIRKPGSPALADDISVDRDVSFGPEHHSLRIRGAGGRARLTPSAFLPQPDDVITIDLDLLPKGDAVHMQFTPVGSAVGTDEVRVAVVPAAGDGQVIELRTIGGRWRCGGAKLVDTGVPVDFDAWNHVQLAVDTARRTYRISLQVVGSAPQLLHEGPLDSLPPDGTPLALELGCVRKSPRADGPAFDNVLVTQRNP